MPYTELIKNFNRIRAYMRSFYVYGFRHRGEFAQKSARGYDDERRRVESWLSDYMTFRQDAAGRRFFLSVDSRAIPHNPLYRAFRARSFTDRDIMLHFHLLDILSEAGGLAIFDIMEALTRRLNAFENADYPDESTVRRKLSEYERLGLVIKQKQGRQTLYLLRPEGTDLERWRDALDFFSEVAPLGMLGDFCRDRLSPQPSPFRFKHHYILNALDGEVTLALLQAIGQGREVALAMGKRTVRAIPVKLCVSVQSGRQHLLGWTPWKPGFAFFRVDAIDTAKPGEPARPPEDLDRRLEAFMAHVWGASAGDGSTLYDLSMTVYAGPDAPHIPARLEREKRCGQVTRLDDTHWRFTARLYDPLEALPWLRTFIGRITELECDDPQVTRRFWDDLAAMAQIYGGDGDALS